MYEFYRILKILFHEGLELNLAVVTLGIESFFISNFSAVYFRPSKAKESFRLRLSCALSFDTGRKLLRDLCLLLLSGVKRSRT